MVVSVGYARDAGEAIGIDRIHRDRHASQAGIFQRPGEIGKQVAVGGKRDVQRFPAVAAL